VSGPRSDPRDPKAREARLDRLRDEARAQADLRPPRPPRPEPGAEHGYYGEPILKAPVWTWEIPLYFFLGGTAGAAAVIALGGYLAGEFALARAALTIAALGALASPPLLISDLGRPRRFLYMLRVAKARSPMSLGVWVLVLFTPAAAIALTWRAGWLAIPAAFGIPALVLAALLGLPLATYTGVLLAVSAIPVWNAHRRLLPPHFAASALGSAAALLELAGFQTPVTQRLGLAASLVEVVIGAVIELRHRRVDRVLRHGRTGWAIRIGGLLTGPVSLGLRLAFGGHARALAAVSFLAGAILTRYAWLWAGRASAADLGALFALQEPGVCATRDRA
jgi:formate-dependent nitrite reductase membrane component NrfD